MRSFSLALPLTAVVLGASCHLVVGADDYLVGAAAGGSGGQQATGAGGAGGAADGGGGTGGSSSSWLEGYSYRKAITFSPTSADLSGFVAGILIDEDQQLADRAQDDGDDLAFAAADGSSRLPHEIERFDGTSGRLVAWVRVPELSGTAPTTIYLYYANPSATDQQAVHDTWSGTFAGVWHLSDNLSVAPGSEVRDSSESANHGTVVGAGTAPVAEWGIAGQAASFDGSAVSISLGDPTDESLDFDTDSFSYSVWVRVETSAGDYDMPWYKGGASAGDPGYDFELGTNGWIAGLSDVVSQPIAAVSLGNEADNRNRWTHLVAVVDRSQGSFIGYVNGAERDQDTIAHFASVSTARDAHISHGGHPMRGRVDEMRVYRTALRPEWIAAEYANLNAPSSFFTVGGEQAAPLDG